MQAKNASFLAVRSVAHLRKTSCPGFFFALDSLLCRKREHLLTQIREQATQIQQLIAQLEATKRQPQPRVRTLSSGRRSSPGADLLSPIDSTLSDSSDSSPKPDVEEWIAKARESFEAFGEFIGAGGVEMTKKFLVDEDPENSGGSDDDNYEFALEDDEGETTPIDELFAERSSSDHDGEQMGISTASVSGVNGGPVPVPKKKSSNGSEKLVILPGEAAPFGLIASLSLKARKRRGSDVTADDDDDVGVASGDFFRSMFIILPPVLYSGLPFVQVPPRIPQGPAC